MENGHGDLRLAITEINAHMDKRIDGLEGQLALWRANTVTTAVCQERHTSHDKLCDERHVTVDKRLDGLVDKKYFAWTSATLLAGIAVIGFAIAYGPTLWNLLNR